MSEQQDSVVIEDPRFQELLVWCVESLERGETLDRAKLAEEHPEFAATLFEFLDDREMLDRMASDLRDRGGNPRDAKIGEATLAPQRRNGVDFEVGAKIRYIGEYEILEEIARGGMGVVFKARQQRLRRVVALKMILAGQLAHNTDVERFKREAQAAGQLKHPNIVAVHEVGEYRGHHYFSMDYIEGRGLAELIREESLPPRLAADIVRTVAEAVAFAHAQGVLHRDLKPANILLDKQGNPHITDFGLAKVAHAETSSADLTQVGQILGTPNYMSPEQASGKSALVCPLSDVFSLGAVLYACLTGRAPFLAESPAETLLQVIGKDPVPPRLLNPQTPRDLDTICLKCLQKDPAKRYRSAEELAEDLRRWEAGKPILARPTSMFERCVKWARRNPAVAGLTLAVAFATILGTFMATRLAIRAAREAARAEHAARLALKNAEEARRQTESAKSNATQADRQAENARAQLRRAELLRYAGTIREAQLEWESNNAPAAFKRLAETRADLRGWEYHYLLARFQQGQQTLTAHQQPITSVDVSPDGSSIVSAAGGQDRGNATCEIIVWNADSGKVLHTFKGHTDAVPCVRFSPDGKWVASASRDRTIKLWDAATGKEIRTLKGHTAPVLSLAFRQDGSRIASGSEDKTIKVWNSATGAELLSIVGHTGRVASVEFSPDGKQILAGGRTVRLWDAENGKQLFSRGWAGWVHSVDVSPDGQRLVAAGAFGHVQRILPKKTIEIWDTPTGELLLPLVGHTDWVFDARFSPDGKRVVSASADRTVRIWDADSGAELSALQGHTNWVTSAAFTPDGRHVVSGSRDGTVRIWDADQPQGVRRLDRLRFFVYGLDFSPDGKHFVSAGGVFPKSAGEIKIWDAKTGAEIRSLEGHMGPLFSASYSPDGKQIATAGRDRSVKIWNVATGTESLSVPGSRAIFSPDGRLITADEHFVVKIWQGAEEVMSLSGHTRGIRCLACSPDAQRIASGGADESVIIWDASGGSRLQTLGGHEDSVLGICFSPDGKRIATAGEDQSVRIWDAESGREIFVLKEHTAAVHSVCFSPDGSRMASAGEDKTVLLWDAEHGHALLSLRDHTGAVHAVRFSPDGTRLISGGTDREIRVWETQGP